MILIIRKFSILISRSKLYANWYFLDFNQIGIAIEFVDRRAKHKEQFALLLLSLFLLFGIR